VSGGALKLSWISWTPTPRRTWRRRRRRRSRQLPHCPARRQRPTDRPSSQQQQRPPLAWSHASHTYPGGAGTTAVAAEMPGPVQDAFLSLPQGRQRPRMFFVVILMGVGHVILDRASRLSLDGGVDEVSPASQASPSSVVRPKCRRRTVAVAAFHRSKSGRILGPWPRRYIDLMSGEHALPNFSTLGALAPLGKSRLSLGVTDCVAWA
jgi:hypothetical protein